MSEVAPGEVMLDRACEIEHGHGGPPSQRERAALDTSGPGIALAFGKLTSPFEGRREELEDLGELARRVRKLPPAQQRRFGKIKAHEARRYLRLWDNRNSARIARIHAPARRVSRERRPAGRSSARAPTGDDPPGSRR